MSDPVGGIAEELIPEADGEPTGSLSIRDRLRAERDEVKAQTTIDMIVPGYDSLAIRYQGIPERDVEKFLKAVGKSKEGLKAAYDLLIRTCETVLIRPEEGADLEPLEDDEGDPIKFDVRLAEFLGFESKSARDTVVQVFSPDGTQVLAPFEHATNVMAWLQGKGNEIDPVLLGE